MGLSYNCAQKHEEQFGSIRGFSHHIIDIIKIWETEACLAEIKFESRLLFLKFKKIFQV